ncbi:MAG: CHAT domain-containing protein [Phaeodactylibacter sp.]|nr:CHAT domain-containing protein [Phaeodactylibacter sp.]
MDILLLAFSNSRESPLPTLTEEYAAINKILSPRVLRQHFLSWAVSHATLDDISYYLTLFRSRLRLFLFSGHAGRDRLLTEGGDSRAAGIAYLLGLCPKLQVVILNGCSTAGQVQALHEAGVPLVIATAAQVGDEAAMQFSKRLFQALEVGLSLEEAFEQSIGAALAQADIDVRRGTGFEGEAPDNPLWGIFPNPAAPDAGGWKLPAKAAQPAPAHFAENELLLETLYETLATSNPRVRQLYEQGAVLEERKEEIVAALLKALPAPISEHVRKLVAPSPPGSAGGWDTIGPGRLHQVSQTYQICMDFMIYVLAAQAWDHLIEFGDSWEITPALKPELEAFFNMDRSERHNLDHFSILRLLHEVLKANAGDIFITEYSQLKEEFLENEEVKTACFFLENLRQQGAFDFPPAEMAELNARAEESLAFIFSKLGFIGNYLLATVRNIDVQKYRHTEQAQFEHMVVKWHGTLGFYDREFRRQPEFMDNRSVVLLRLGGEGKRQFLNLSPFVIDENTFEAVPDTSLSKLYFFAYRSARDGHLMYKYVNDPEGDVIDLDAPEFYDRRKKASKFQLAKAQFEAFYEQIFDHKPLLS